MHEALAMVRRDLGHDAAVLHTREVQTRRFFGWLSGPREIEVTASRGVNVPSRLPPRTPYEEERGGEGDVVLRHDGPHALSAAHCRPQPELGGAMQSQLTELQTMVQELCRRSEAPRHDLPEELFRLFTDLLDSDLSEELARELVERVQTESKGSRMDDLVMVKARLARMIEAELRVSGPIQITPGRCRLAALVGPTGVGKTTTIAKLAANYHLKEKRRVGLITVDTYRIAAVEQLRTYADIIDLPMQVVSTPREMREAVGRMENLDLILLDTAGRSPKDEVRIQELRAFLTEADADEVHLVLSSVAGADAGAGGRALRRGGHHLADPHKTRRGHLPGKHLAADSQQPVARKLPDQRPERAGRHRDCGIDAGGAIGSGNGRKLGRTRRREPSARQPKRFPKSKNKARRTAMDQATDLRALVRQVAAAHPPAAPRPRRLVVFGGKGGVGTTTIAVNLAVALAQGGQRSLLCDAAGGDAALLCGLEPRHTLADALAGNLPLARILQPGPAGVQVLPGTRELVRWQETAEHAWNRLMTQIASLAPRPEAVVIDAGSQPDCLARQLWQAADRVLLVTTVETAAIMNAYAAIKLLSDPTRAASIALVVNRAPRPAEAVEAQRRLAQACRRFLGLPLRGLGHLPEDGAAPQSAARGEPCLLAMPACPASLCLRQLVRAMGNEASAERRRAA